MNRTGWSGRLSIGVGGAIADVSLYAMYDITPNVYAENVNSQIPTYEKDREECQLKLSASHRNSISVKGNENKFKVNLIFSI